jgi:hypothetical protein
LKSTQEERKWKYWVQPDFNETAFQRNRLGHKFKAKFPYSLIVCVSESKTLLIKSEEPLFHASVRNKKNLCQLKYDIKAQLQKLLLKCVSEYF